MKFKKKEITALLSRYRVNPQNLGLGQAQAKDYFREIMGYYFSQTGDAYGKIQRTKAKYLLEGNSREALVFQEELVTDILNRVLSLPDKALAAKNQAAGEKFMEQRHDDVCMLLLLDKFLGKNFDRGAAADFKIPQETIAVLKHKRALLDPKSNEEPDAKYDGRFLEKFTVAHRNAPDEEPFPGHEALQNELDAAAREENIPGRDSFDVFWENTAGADKLKDDIYKLNDIPQETRARFDNLLQALFNADGLSNRYKNSLGHNALLCGSSFDAETIAAAVDAIRNFPEDLSAALSGHPEIYSRFQSMFRALKDIDLVKNGGEFTKTIIPLENGIEHAEYSGPLVESIKAAAKTQSEKTLYANIDAIRTRLNEFGETKQLTDREIVAQMSQYMLEDPESQPEKQFANAIDFVRQNGLTAAKQTEYQKNLILAVSAKAESASDWAKVAKSIAKVEVLKTMEPDAVPDLDALEKRAAEMLTEKPVIAMNVFMHNRTLCEAYVTLGADMTEEFHYMDAPLPEVDLDDAYADMQENLVNEDDGESLLPDNRPVVPWESDRERFQRAANEDRNNYKKSFGEEFLIEIPKTHSDKWGRVPSTLMKLPKKGLSAEDAIRQNAEFLIRLEKNETLQNGKTFRQQVLLDEIEKIKSLDPEELCHISSDRELLEKWPEIAERWGSAFIVKDILGAAEAEGLQVPQEEIDFLYFQNDLATGIYMPLEHYRNDYLTNPYAPLLEGTNPLEIRGSAYQPEFCTTLCQDYGNGMLKKQEYDKSVKLIPAMKAAGLLPPADLSHSIVCAGRRMQPTGRPLSYFDIPENETFSIQKPGKAPVFYRYDPVNKDFFRAASQEKIDLLLERYQNVAVARQEDRAYEPNEYRNVIKTPMDLLGRKFLDNDPETKEPVIRVTKKDAARMLALQAALENLEKHAADPDEFRDAFEQIANEEYIEDVMGSILANPLLDTFIERMGGMDEDGLLLTRAQRALGGENALENFRQYCDLELAKREAAESRETPLTPEEKTALSRLLTEELAEAHPKLNAGEENADLYAATNKVFRYLLLQKSLADGTPLTQKELSETAYAYTFDPAYTGLRLSTASPRLTVAFAEKFTEHSSVDYDLPGIMGKLLDRYLEMQQPGFETDEAFFERKFEETHRGQQVSDEQKEAAKKDFLNLCDANHLIWVGNPDKVKSPEEIWTLHADDNLDAAHNAAVEQQKMMHGNREITNSHPPRKKYLDRGYALNLPDELTGSQRIEMEKAKALLQGNSPEALIFQRKYTTEMINRMLSVPDEMLAQSATPESRAFYAAHYREIQLLHDLPYFYGSKASNTHGFSLDFTIPENIEKALFHKHALAEQFINNDQEQIKSLATESYKVTRLYSDLTETDLYPMSQGNGVFDASDVNRNLTTKLISENFTKKNTQSAQSEQPNAAYDGLHLEEDAVGIRAVPEYRTVKQKLAELDQLVNARQIVNKENFAAFRQALETFEENYNALPEGGSALVPVFTALQNAANTYVTTTVPRNGSYNSLPAEDLEAVKFANKLKDYCKEKAAYYTVKANVADMEKAMGIVDLSLPVDSNRTYTMNEYRGLLHSSRTQCAEVIQSAIQAGTEIKKEHLARLFVLDTLQKRLANPEEGLEAEDVASFLSETYVLDNIKVVQEDDRYKEFMNAKEPITEEFVSKDLSEAFTSHIQERNRQEAARNRQQNEAEHVRNNGQNQPGLGNHI